MSQVNSLKIFVFIFFLFFIFNLFNCEQLIEDWEVNSLTRDFIRWYAQTFPGEIAISDERKIDIELFNPDLKNIASINEQLNRFAGRIMLVDTSSISFKSRVNFFILKNKINYLLFEFQEWKRWQYDSYFYTEKLFDTFEILRALQADSSANISLQFLGSIKAIPGFLKNARKNLVHRKMNNIDNVLAQIEIIKTMLPVQIANITISDTLILDSLNYFSEIALDSLESFQQFITNEKNSTPDSLSHLDKNMYQSLIANLLVKDGQIDSLIKIVERDYLISIEEMAAIAFVFFREENKTVEKYSKERLCQLMIDEINKDIPRKDQIIPLCIERDNYHKLFVDEVVDFSLPTDYSLKIDWDSNTNYQSEKLIKLMLVNLFADSCFLQIKLKPIPSAIGWIAQLSTLRDYNRAHLKAAMLLDGFPLHYYFWFKKRNELPLTVKVFPDQQYLAGFTYNFASTLAASGLGGYDQLLEFVILNNFARVCFNALVELKYYLKQYSKPQVDSLFVASKLFNLNKSISLVKDITCYPGQKLQTYCGIRTFKKLEEKCFNYQKRKFRKKEFYKFVLKQGPIPLDLLEERLFSHFLK